MFNLIFTQYLYTPFLNVLIWLYWLSGKLFTPADIGVAMILFAIAVKIILLPFSLLGQRSAAEKYRLTSEIKRLKKELSTEPAKLKEATKKLLRQSPGAVISEALNFLIQFLIIVMLYRLFTTGIEGEDLHLIYSWMPDIEKPINLLFLGYIDLSHTNSFLNIIQSSLIVLNESLHLYFAPQKPTRKDLLSLVVLFPLVSFFVFMFLPAGKKIYIITALIISVFLQLLSQIYYLSYALHRRLSHTTSKKVEASPKPKSTSD